MMRKITKCWQAFVVICTFNLIIFVQWGYINSFLTFNKTDDQPESSHPVSEVKVNDVVEEQAKVTGSTKANKINESQTKSNESQGNGVLYYITKVRELAHSTTLTYGVPPKQSLTEVNVSNIKENGSVKYVNGKHSSIYKQLVTEHNEQALPATGRLVLFSKKSKVLNVDKTRTVNHKGNTKVAEKTRTFDVEQCIRRDIQESIIDLRNTTIKVGQLEAETGYFRRRDSVVNKYTHKFKIVPDRSRCRQDHLMVILVHSKPSYYNKREAIRLTWGRMAENNNSTALWPGNYKMKAKFSLVFVTGTDRDPKWNQFLEMENMLHGDILQGDFYDAYTNMTLKSLLGLKYVAQHCNHISYMVKSDDDMFIDLPFLVKKLQEKQYTNSIIGPFNKHSSVHRKGKWKLTLAEYPFTRFPPYESGSTYIFTIDIVKKLLDTSDYVPWIFIDDVYITGILGKILNIQHVVWKSMFSFWSDREPTTCDVIMCKKIAYTKCSPDKLFEIWGILQHRAFYKCKS